MYRKHVPQCNGLHKGSVQLSVDLPYFLLPFHVDQIMANTNSREKKSPQKPFARNTQIRVIVDRYYVRYIVPNLMIKKVFTNHSVSFEFSFPVVIFSDGCMCSVKFTRCKNCIVVNLTELPAHYYVYRSRERSQLWTQKGLLNCLTG